MFDMNLPSGNRVCSIPTSGRSKIFPQTGNVQSCWGDIFLGFFMVLPGASTTFVGQFRKKKIQTSCFASFGHFRKGCSCRLKGKHHIYNVFYSKQSTNKRIKSGRDWNGVLGSFALGRPLRPDNTLWNYNFMGQKHNPTMKYSLCVAWWYRHTRTMEKSPFRCCAWKRGIVRPKNTGSLVLALQFQHV